MTAYPSKGTDYAALFILAAIASSCVNPSPRVRQPGAMIPNACKGIGEAPRAREVQRDDAAIRRCLSYPKTAPARLIDLQLLFVPVSTGGWEESIGVYDVGADTAPLGGPFLLSVIRPGTRVTVAENTVAGDEAATAPLSLTLSRRETGVDISLDTPYQAEAITTRSRTLAFSRARLSGMNEVMLDGSRYYLSEQRWPAVPSRLLVFADRPAQQKEDAPGIVGVPLPPDAGGESDMPVVAPLIDEQSSRAEAMIKGKLRRFARDAAGRWGSADQ